MIDPTFARRGLFLVFVILLLDIIGIAIIMPVLPAYLEELTGPPSARLRWKGVAAARLCRHAVPVCAVYRQSLGSVRAPARPLASVLTFAIDNLICALATSYWMLFVGRILAGISGASIATCSAYIADVSNDQNRSKNFGLIGIAFGVGFVLGPIIGGFLGGFGARVPFFGAAFVSLVNFVLACFMLPETLEAKNRRRFDLSRANPFGALKQMRSYPGIGWIGLVFFSTGWLTPSIPPSGLSSAPTGTAGTSGRSVCRSACSASAAPSSWASSCRAWCPSSANGGRRWSVLPSVPLVLPAMPPPGRVDGLCGHRCDSVGKRGGCAAAQHCLSLCAGLGAG